MGIEYLSPARDSHTPPSLPPSLPPSPRRPGHPPVLRVDGEILQRQKDVPDHHAEAVGGHLYLRASYQRVRPFIPSSLPPSLPSSLDFLLCPSLSSRHDKESPTHHPLPPSLPPSLPHSAFLAGVPVLSAGAFSGFNLAVWKKQLAYATTRDVQVRKEGGREGGEGGRKGGGGSCLRVLLGL